MKKLTTLLLVLLLFADRSQASHFSGGEIRYEYNGNNYTVHVTLFKLCVGGINLTNTVDVGFQSSSTSINFVRQLNLVNFDTVNINCPGTVSSCYNASSPIPGYIAAYYKDTVSLPPATDWLISCSNSARISGIANLTNAGSMYLETTMDNSSAINSNPLIANIPTYYMTAGNPISVPVQCVDPEGDSVVYSLITPLDGYVGTPSPCTYAPGFSLTNPFGTGGTCTINNTTKMMTLMSPSTGYYVIAFRVMEYRNGIVVGNYVRDIMVVVLSGTSALTFPNANTGTSFNVYTCPGQTNSVTLGFNDPTTTDSVYVTVIPPTLPGWTFSSTTSNGLGGATTTISWTTPSSMNPATLPQFFIRIRTRDNACPNASADFGLVVRTRQCLADSVWPGDANGDYTVNVYDPLAIAIANGQTGATRTGATTTWIAQACAPWTNSFVTNNTNMKHADCDGNGTVNSTDLSAVTANYSLSHPKTTAAPHAKTTGLPDLYVDVTGIHFSAGSAVSVPIKLGSSNSPMNNIYGLATSFIIDGITLGSEATISYGTSWLGNSSNTLSFAYAKGYNVLDWAYCRTNQTNTSGQGTIAYLNFTIPAGTPPNTPFQIRIDEQKTRVIDYKGLIVTNYNLNDANAKTEAGVNVEYNYLNQYEMIVVPNPSVKNAVLQLSIPQSNASINMTVTDISGRIVWQHSEYKNAGKQIINLPDELSGGIYMIAVDIDGTRIDKPVKWIKE